MAMKPVQLSFLGSVVLFSCVALHAQTTGDGAPPLFSSQGTLRADAQCDANEKTEWATPTEKDCYRTTPDYAETMEYLRRVEKAAPRQVKILPFGKTGEGRELNIVVATRDGDFDPASLHAKKRPILLVQNAIHPGEMDGKDASLALLRDMVITKTQAKLMERAVFVFIPVFNLDGHERRSAYNRINQNGPAVIGWRGNGSNLNLNRDYMKADTPEMHAFLAMFHRWLPDFYVDDHVTDGADYQYDVTFTLDEGPDVAPNTRRWIHDVATPALQHAVDTQPGHLASPTYINAVDGNDLAKGFGFNYSPPRFSDGYTILEGRPGMLVEMHMLKDYRTRVTGNYFLLAGLLELMNRDADTLIALNAKADDEAKKIGAEHGTKFPLTLDWDGKEAMLPFKGYKYTRSLSEVSGAMWVDYSHDTWDTTLPYHMGGKVGLTVAPPAAYIVPAQWTHVIDILAAHQVEMSFTKAPWSATVESHRCGGMTWQDPPFEGRHPTFNGEAVRSPGKYGECKLVKEDRTFPVGSAVVKLNQQLSRVAIHWLEPDAPDSALQWGLFDSIFEQKEYGEDYVVEKLAREMMKSDPKLKAEFETKVASDPAFASNSAARLAFFYDRSPWGKANRVGEYPIGRLENVDEVPLK